MIKIGLIASLAAGMFLTAHAADSKYPPSGLESIEWCDLWISHGSETNLPRVLLIGDSITRAYYPAVEKNLAGKAYVGRLATSAFISDPILLKEVAMVLDEYDFDVIHFNNGLHGMQHTDAEYEKAFPAFLKVIKAHAPHAKLIWASCTPLKAAPKPGEDRVSARNAIALKIIQAQGIPVDDLYTPMSGHPEYHSDNAHFGDQGITIQAAQVAAKIEPMLAH